MRCRVTIESRDLARPFRTAQVERRQVRLLVVEVDDGGQVGRGESFPHEAFGQTAERARAQLEAMSDVASADRLPPGPARDALDQALWDLRAKQQGWRVWEHLGRRPRLVETMFTIGLGDLDEMRAAAAAHRRWPVLKIKTGPQRCLQRIDAVRDGAPGASLVVDGNESWSAGDYHRLAPALARRGVVLLEQPLPRGAEEALRGRRPVPVCADESFRDGSDLQRVVGCFDAVNVKLAKAGGLSAALDAARDAQAMGLDVLVGCMVSTSLAIAPAWVVALEARWADLDGPLLLSEDRRPPMPYDEWRIGPPPRDLWG